MPDKLFISPIRGKTMQHHPPLAAVTLASHSLRVMKAAGIATSRIKSHAVRKTVATAQIDLGEDIDVVMQRGRWRSYTVFQQFYNRSKRHLQQCSEVLALRSVGPQVVPTAPVGPDRVRPPPKRQRQATNTARLQEEQVEAQRKPVHNDLAGQSRVPKGKGGAITDDHHCFACAELDDDSLIWCQWCNKHLHVWHFEGDPEQVLADLAQGGSGGVLSVNRAKCWRTMVVFYWNGTYTLSMSPQPLSMVTLLSVSQSW
jgi:hypothetical protein